MLTEGTSQMPLVERVAAPPTLSLLLLGLAFLWCVDDCASTHEKYGSFSTGDRKRVASIASPAITLKPRPATLLLGVTTLMPALVILGKSTSLKLSRQLTCCMISMLTSHLCATYDASVKMRSTGVKDLRKCKLVNAVCWSPPHLRTDGTC